MESSVEELGDLKHSISLEITYEEVKPTYDAVYKQLKKILNDLYSFGRFPLKRINQF